ncbi:WD40-repeat-containing domain protein [Actinidia chinensis var. chinensis]|uniref:WD40-repeat-containing domain protein n=1 Tax=Actinidia chinensis var. chinensis TaxID=1590841 RepID=A0A2R6RF51_ACTCC|nr:WD40-repeat-containing domain protein [Actinidia chinensis var. chinensis]
MGLLPCPLACQSNDVFDSQSHFNHLHHSDSLSTSSSLSSQPSLPSVPSLINPSQPPAAAHHYCAATLNGHSYVFSLAIAGKHLYSGSSDSEIQAWPRNPSSLQNSASNAVAVCNSAVKSIVVLGEKLFTAHQDHKIRVWKINNETPNEKYQNVAVLPTISDRVSRLFAAKNYVKIRRHKKCTWVHHVDTVSALALSSDGSHLYSVSWDRSFKVWRTADFKCLESVWNAHDDAINAIAVSNDGCVYTGSADKKIKVWKRKEGESKHTLVDTLEKHVSAVNSLALSTDGSVLYSGACDRSIIVWEKDGGRGDGEGMRHMVVVGALRGHTKAILCLAVVSDLVFSGSADKTVRIWMGGLDRKYCCLGVLEGHRGPVKCLAAAVDNSSGDSNSSSGTSYKVYGGSLDCDIKVWQVWVPFL